ncbi:MAG: NAD(P)H-binding protein [Pseudomonadota bacterium]|nr:NAD(P)H-binding protein [Pseudomonadota bacterium]
MKLFVTGATGVIGRRAVPLLVKRGHHVTALVRSPGSEAVLLGVGARPTFVDLFDLGALSSVVAGHDVVVSLATHIPSSSFHMLLPSAWRENDRIRSVASANLVDAAIASGVQRFIQESFAPVYPDRGGAWIAEHTPIAPVRYNRTIEDAERAALRFTESGRTGIVLRFGAFYGSDAVQTLDLIKFVRKGWAPIPGAADAFISSVSHDDAATAVVAALDAHAGIYNVVDDEPLSHRAYIDALAAALGVAPPKLPPPWVAHLFGSLGELLARSVRISSRKFKRETSWTPKYPSVREGWRAVVSALGRAA